MAGKKQAVLMELLSRYKKTSAPAAGLEVPPWYRRAASGIPDGRRGRNDEQPTQTAEAPEPAPAPAADWSSQSQAMETEFTGSAGGRTAPAAMFDRSPFDDTPQSMPEEPVPSNSEPAPQTMSAPPEVDSPSRAGEWFKETWGKLRRKLTFRKAPGPIPNPGAATDGPAESADPLSVPVMPLDAMQTGETSVEGSPPVTAGSSASGEVPLMTLEPGRLHLSMPYPLVGISVLCLVLLCGICFLMGKTVGERAKAPRSATASLTDAGDQAGRPAKAESAAVPAVGRLIATNRRVDRREGAYYLVIAGLPDTDWGAKELQRAAKWLNDNYGLETTLETVHTNYRSLVMVDGFTESAGAEVDAARRLIEACDREYSHLGGCTFKGPYTRRFPWGSAE